MNEMTIYWITRLDNINVLITLLMLLSAVMSLIGVVLYCARYSTMDEQAVGRKIVWIALPLAMLLALALVFTPTTKEMIAIKGIPAVVDVAKSHNMGEKAERVCNALLKIIEDKAKGSK